MAPALIYLASDEGGWITGRTLSCFGNEIHLYWAPARVWSPYNTGSGDLEVLFEHFCQALG